MTWDPPDLWATIILSIPGGIVAGVLVLLAQGSVRQFYEFLRRWMATRDIGRFFEQWEKTINETDEIPSQGGSPPVPRDNVRFAKHGQFMRRAANLIQRYQNILTPAQIEELDNYLGDHQAVIDLVGPKGGVFKQIHYDNFFDQARDIKWLKF